VVRKMTSNYKMTRHLDGEVMRTGWAPSHILEYACVGCLELSRRLASRFSAHFEKPDATPPRRDAER